MKKITKKEKPKSESVERLNIKNYPEGIQTAVNKLLFHNEIRKPFKLINNRGSWRIEKNHESIIIDAEDWLKRKIDKVDHPWNIFRSTVYEAYCFGSNILKRGQIDRKVLLDGLDVRSSESETNVENVEISVPMVHIIKLKNILINLGMTTNHDFKMLCRHLKIRDRKTGELVHKDYEKFRQLEDAYAHGRNDKNPDFVIPTEEEIDQIKNILRV